MAVPQVVDVHAHLYPEAFREGGGYLHPSTFDAEALLAEQESAEIDCSVLSNPMILARPGRYDLWSLEAVHLWHEFAGALVRRYPGRFVGLACAVPFAPEFLREAQRALDTYGFRGVLVNSNVRGEYIDSERAYPFYEWVVERRVPLFVHPPTTVMGADRMETPRLGVVVGRPCDTALAAVRLILAGTLDRFPLTLILAHGGGALPSVLGRLMYGYELRGDPGFEPWPTASARPPRAYLQHFYADSMVFHEPALRCTVETFGRDHVLLGSDHPPVVMPLKESVAAVRALGLDGDATAQILGGTARRLFGLP